MADSSPLFRGEQRYISLKFHRICEAVRAGVAKAIFGPTPSLLRHSAFKYVFVDLRAARVPLWRHRKQSRPAAEGLQAVRQQGARFAD